MRRFSIYLLTNTRNGKSYVGRTVYKSASKRWSTHKWAAKRGSTSALHAAIRKYGSGAFVLEVLDRVTTLKGAVIAEVCWIEQRCTVAPAGYNLSPGGLGPIGVKRTDEYRSKQRAAWSPERRERAAAMMRGNTWAARAVRRPAPPPAPPRGPHPKLEDVVRLVAAASAPVPRRDIAAALGLPLRQADHVLAVLRKQGRIHRFGETRAGGYVIPAEINGETFRQR